MKTRPTTSEIVEVIQAEGEFDPGRVRGIAEAITNLLGQAGVEVGNIAGGNTADRYIPTVVLRLTPQEEEGWEEFDEALIEQDWVFHCGWSSDYKEFVIQIYAADLE